jgi:hypothetical protein
MSSVQRLIANHTNVIAAADLAATHVRPARAVRTLSVSRAGNGRVRLAGEYTGHEAAEFELAVQAGGGTPRASTPVFSGIGNGTLAVTDVQPAAVLQTLTLTLADLGVDTTYATRDLRDVVLQADAAGAAGNSIRLEVDSSALVRTATTWSLLADWPASTTYQAGEQWAFGGFPLTSGGQLADATQRLQFGDDPTIYRPYREYKEGAWRYGLSPALERDVRTGTKVWQITGGYTVSVSDGVTVETYPGIVTLYDLLAALDASALIDVIGVVNADKTPGGMAAIDLPLRTAAWVLSVTGKTVPDGLLVASTAPTEKITVRCAVADAVGYEQWTVEGAVSGRLADAVSGELYTDGPLTMTIPRRLPPGNVITGRTGFRYTAVQREEGEGLPAVCVNPFKLGVNASRMSVTFRYEQRPPADCSCAGKAASGVISGACLGLDTTIGGTMSLPTEVASRVEAIYTWRQAFIEANTYIADGTQSTPDWVWYQGLAASGDIASMEGGVQMVLSCLNDVYQDTAALAAWDQLWLDVKTDLELLLSNRNSGIGWLDDGPYRNGVALGADYFQRYQSRIDNIRIMVGIYPNFNSAGSCGDGCWRDDPSATHWWVDTNGRYLPIFSNQTYVSSVRDENGAPVSTKEFGVGIVVACEDRLKVGDSVTITIDRADTERPYQVGDEIIIAVVGAGPAYLSGGVDGTDTQTWVVSGSVDGTLPPYSVPAAGAPTYTASGATVQLAPGGIPFALGDSFSIAIEAGQFVWRRDGGTWSVPVDIEDSVPLADGLAAEWLPGIAPSFVGGDTWTFRAEQPFAPSNVRRPTTPAWAWDGSGGALVADLGAPTDISAVAIALYHLPGGAVTVEGGDGSVWPVSATLDISGQVAVVLLPNTWTVSHLRLTVAGAAGGRIGWWWAGAPLATTHHASTCRITRAWARTRGDAINPRALYAGRGAGGELAWDTLTDADVEAVLALVDHCHMLDEPAIVVPHHLHPDEAALVRIDADAVDVVDEFEYQPDNTAHRLLQISLPLAPVLQ